MREPRGVHTLPRCSEVYISFREFIVCVCSFFCYFLKRDSPIVCNILYLKAFLSFAPHNQSRVTCIAVTAEVSRSTAHRPVTRRVTVATLTCRRRRVVVIVVVVVVVMSTAAKSVIVIMWMSSSSCRRRTSSSSCSSDGAVIVVVVFRRRRVALLCRTASVCQASAVRWQWAMRGDVPSVGGAFSMIFVGPGAGPSGNGKGKRQGIGDNKDGQDQQDPVRVFILLLGLPLTVDVGRVCVAVVREEEKQCFCRRPSRIILNPPLCQLVAEIYPEHVQPYES